MTIYVNCLENDNKEERKFNSIETALEELKNCETMSISPGIYSGINLQSNNTLFEYRMIGTGKDVEICNLKHVGMVNCCIKHLRLKKVILSVENSVLDFRDVEFSGSNIFSCIGNFENNKVEINFIDCIFGINYQLIIRSGLYSIKFRNCIFRTKRTIPVIMAKQCTINLNLSLCDFDMAFIHNDRSNVKINHINCNFFSLWVGNSCSSFCYYDEVIKNFLFLEGKDTNEEELIFTENRFDYSIKKRTEKICFRGRYPITVFLPKNVVNGHSIFIISDCPYIEIESIEYYARKITLKFYNKQWIIKEAKQNYRNIQGRLLPSSKKFSTNEFEYVEIPFFAKFANFFGDYPITIKLPNIEDVEEDHCIEIYNTCPFIIIDKIKYCSSMLKIRIVENSWLICNFC